MRGLLVSRLAHRMHPQSVERGNEQVHASTLALARMLVAIPCSERRPSIFFVLIAVPVLVAGLVQTPTIKAVV